jgi:hypothetical protein
MSPRDAGLRSDAPIVLNKRHGLLTTVTQVEHWSFGPPNHQSILHLFVLQVMDGAMNKYCR